MPWSLLGHPAYWTRGAMLIQLKLWELPRVNLAAKIIAEKKAGAEVFYHFGGRPLAMVRP